jgi:sec-independent protein translocase protein TatA
LIRLLDFAPNATLVSDPLRLPYASLPVTTAIVYGIGVTELLIVLAIVLLIVGPKRLPRLGRQLGGGLREFKDAITRRHDEADEPAAEPAHPSRPELPAGDR